jgi:hypothetical protein
MDAAINEFARAPFHEYGDSLNFQADHASQPHTWTLPANQGRNELKVGTAKMKVLAIIMIIMRYALLTVHGWKKKIVDEFECAFSSFWCHQIGLHFLFLKFLHELFTRLARNRLCKYDATDMLWNSQMIILAVDLKLDSGHISTSRTLRIAW